MKTPTFILLAASLAFNAALAFFLVRGASQFPAANPVTAVAVASTPAKTTSPGIDDTIWPAMQTSELPTLVARLRTSGFPPDMVRAILAAQINESFDARRKALDPDAGKRPFWKTVPPNPQLQAAQRQIYREQEKMLRDLLGDDAEANDPMTVVMMQRQIGGVPPEKVGEIRQIIREFNDKRSDMYVGGVVTTAEMEKSRNLQKEMEAAIAKALTPAEYAEYELRSSNTASSLRYQLATFDPSEQEFRTIFQLQRAFDEQYASAYYSGTPTPEQTQQMRQRSEAQKVLTEQIRTALGPTRAEDYVRSTDYQYQQTSRLVARLELPPATTNQVYAVQKEFEPRVAAIRQDRTLPADQRTQQLTALQQEANAKVAPLLGGARGLEAYQQYGGTWLRSMVPPPAPPRP